MKTSETSQSDWRIRVLLAAPIAWLALFYAFVIRARLQFGHWPDPYWPDPKSLDFGIHHLAIYFGFLAVLASLAAAIALAVLRHSQGMRSFPWSIIATVAASLAALMVYCTIDPGSYIQWFLD